MKLGVIGAGNMASAIVRGVAASGKVAPGDIWVSDLDADKLAALGALGVHTSGNNADVYQNSDVLIFAVKPNIYPVVLREAAAQEGVADKLLITIAPGITIDTVKSYFSNDVQVVRTMPNTPAMVGAGMTVLCGDVPEQAFAQAEAVFGCVGQTLRLDEKLMDGVVALNGSSPAYIFMLIEAMADAGVQGGVPRAAAYTLAAQSVLGSAKMVLETGKHPGELKDMVCSPAGTTIDAVAVLEKRGFRSSIIEAMAACTEKTKAMAKQ